MDRLLFNNLVGEYDIKIEETSWLEIFNHSVITSPAVATFYSVVN